MNGIGYGNSMFLATHGILARANGSAPPVNTVAPLLSGTSVVGSSLSCTTGTWTGDPVPTYTYQWYRGATLITGATSSSYTLVQADAGNTSNITCQVTASNGIGTATATSNTIAQIYDLNAFNVIVAIQGTGVTLTTTQKNASNQLVIDTKNYGVWTKMKAMYGFLGGTAAAHKFNWVNPLDTDAAFRLVFNGGWTHSATGATPNGTNAYADTKLNPSSSLSLDSTHFSFYSRTNSNGTEIEAGVVDSNGRTNLLEIRTSGTTYIAVNSQGTYTTYADTDSRAFYIANRTASNVVNSWRNSTKKATGTTASSVLSNGNMWLSAWNNIANPALLYYSTKQTAFASIGDGLTDTEAANFYTAVQAFQTTLSRNV
jgi:hypothetical protein